ncbi:hypothetical protein [Streptomyces avidinii]
MRKRSSSSTAWTSAGVVAQQVQLLGVAQQSEDGERDHAGRRLVPAQEQQQTAAGDLATVRSPVSRAG